LFILDILIFAATFVRCWFILAILRTVFSFDLSPLSYWKCLSYLFYPFSEV